MLQEAHKSSVDFQTLSNAPNRRVPDTARSSSTCVGHVSAFTDFLAPQGQSRSTGSRVAFQIANKRTGRVYRAERCASSQVWFQTVFLVEQTRWITKNELPSAHDMPKTPLRSGLLTIVEFHARKCHLPVPRKPPAIGISAELTKLQPRSFAHFSAMVYLFILRAICRNCLQVRSDVKAKTSGQGIRVSLRGHFAPAARNFYESGIFYRTHSVTFKSIGSETSSVAKRQFIRYFDDNYYIIFPLGIETLNALDFDRFCVFLSVQHTFYA
ncbi:hypothetical protein K0M31_010210 [Melipona bicolor]|uniref:Uncharacterized protein n=1 Tax=Melipona bicolor TaxID=60889 RepID=A0AA40FMD0_9HYME|nr:hypothetical protein K0M31_010210 [Melipona bicolor]